GGGLIVISTGWAMVEQADGGARSEGQREGQPQDPFRQAFDPLPFPRTAGPGSVSVAITLGRNAARPPGGNLAALLAAVVASALIALSIHLCYGFADRLAPVLGATAMSVILRLSSFLLVCIGVQILWNGAKALLASLR